MGTTMAMTMGMMATFLEMIMTMTMEMICGTFLDNLDLHLRMTMEMITEMMAMLPSTTMAMTMIRWELTTIIQELTTIIQEPTMIRWELTTIIQELTTTIREPTMIFQVLLNSMTTKWVALPNSKDRRTLRRPMRNTLELELSF